MPEIPPCNKTVVDRAFLEVLCFHIEIQRLIQIVPFKKLRLHKSCCKTVDCYFPKLRQPTGQRLSNIKMQQKKFNWANLMRKI